MTLDAMTRAEANDRAPGQLKNRSPELAARRAAWGEPKRTTIYDWASFATAPPIQLRAFDSSCADLHDAIAVGNHEVWGDPLPPHLPGGAVQLRERMAGTPRAESVQRVALDGFSGTPSRLPHAERLQEAFGHHDLSGVSAHLDGAAQDASKRLGAHGYASGSALAFASSPDLFTAAHEATHIVQQRAGVALSDGVGRSGDVYERHADEVAGLVVRGQSAEAALDRMVGAGRGARPSAHTLQFARETKSTQAVQFKKSRDEVELDEASALIDLEETVDVERPGSAQLGDRNATKVSDLDTTAKKLSEKLEHDIAIERVQEPDKPLDEGSKQRIAELSRLKQNLDEKIAAGAVDKATVLDTMKASGHTDHRIESKTKPDSTRGTSMSLDDAALRREHGATDQEFVEFRENEVAVGKTRGENKTSLIAGKNGYGVERQSNNTQSGDQKRTRIVANRQRAELSHSRSNLRKGTSSGGSFVVDEQGARARANVKKTTGGPDGKTLYSSKVVVGTDQLGVEGEADLAKLRDKDSAISVTVGGGLNASVHTRPVVIEGVPMVALHANASGFLSLAVGGEGERAYGDSAEVPKKAAAQGGGLSSAAPSFEDRPAEGERKKATAAVSGSVKVAYSRAVVRVYNKGAASAELDKVRRAPSLPLVGAHFAKWKAASALLFGDFTPRLPGESIASTSEAEIAAKLNVSGGATASASTKHQWSWTWGEEVGEDKVVRVKLVAVRSGEWDVSGGGAGVEVVGSGKGGRREEITLVFPPTGEGQAARTALYKKLGQYPSVDEVRGFTSRYMDDWSTNRSASRGHGTKASASTAILSEVPILNRLPTVGIGGSAGTEYENEVTIARKEGHIVVDGRGESNVHGEAALGAAGAQDKTRVLEAKVADGGSAHTELVEQKDGTKAVEAQLTTHTTQSRTKVGSSLKGFESVNGIGQFVRDALSDKKLDFRSTRYSHDEVMRLFSRASDHGFWADRLLLVNAPGRVQGAWLTLREQLLSVHKGEPGLRRRIREQSATKDIAAAGLRELELGLKQVHVNAFLEVGGAKGPALIKATIEQAEESLGSRSGARRRGGDHRAWPDELKAERTRFETLESIMKKGLIQHLKDQGLSEPNNPAAQKPERKRLIGECDWLEQRLTVARSQHFEDAEAWGDMLQRLKEWRAVLSDEPKESRTFAKSLEMTSRLRTYKESEEKALAAGRKALLTTTARFYMDWVDLTVEARGVLAGENFHIKLSERGAGERRSPTYEPNVRRVLALWREYGDLKEGADPLEDRFLQRLLTY